MSLYCKFMKFRIRFPPSRILDNRNIKGFKIMKIKKNEQNM